MAQRSVSGGSFQGPIPDRFILRTSRSGDFPENIDNVTSCEASRSPSQASARTVIRVSQDDVDQDERQYYQGDLSQSSSLISFPSPDFSIFEGDSTGDADVSNDEDSELDACQQQPVSWTGKIISCFGKYLCGCCTQGRKAKQAPEEEQLLFNHSDTVEEYESTDDEDEERGNRQPEQPSNSGCPIFSPPKFTFWRNNNLNKGKGKDDSNTQAEDDDEDSEGYIYMSDGGLPRQTRISKGSARYVSSLRICFSKNPD